MTALVAALAALGAVACVRAAGGSGRRPAAGSRRPGRTPASLVALGAWWARALGDAGIEGDPHRSGRLALVAGLGVGGLATLRAGVAGGLVVLVGIRRRPRPGPAGRPGRGDRRADAALPELVEHTARGLRSGLDLVAALATAGRSVGGVHGAEVARVAARVERGAPLVEALGGWGEAQPRSPVRLVVAALRVAAEAGGGRAPALDGLAASLRAQAVVAEEARALATQARASAGVMVVLPVVVATLGAAGDPRLARTLLRTPVGLTCLGTALALDAVGGWWMHRVVDGGAG